MTDGRLLFPATIVVDLVLSVPALPEHGGDVLASGAGMSAGGGFTALAAAAREGGDVVYVGRYGDGPFGAVVAAALRAEGVAAVHPPLSGVDSGYCVVLVDPGAERTFVTAPGAEARLSRADLAAVAVDDGDTVYVSGYGLAHPASPLPGWLAGLPERARVVFDPSPLVGTLDADTLEGVLGRADVVTANAREARILTGSASPNTAAAALLGRIRAGGLAIVRDGAEGCWLAAGDGTAEHVPGFPVTAVDTTGAGDAHGGVLAAALARGEVPVAAARRANAAAALAVLRRGPAGSPPAATTDRVLAAGRIPPVDRAVVQDVTLANPRPVGRIQSRRITMLPGVVGGLHLHNGPVVGSIERGSAVYQVEGGPARTLGVGDTFYEEEGARVARFDAGPDGVVFLAHFPVGADEEPTITML